MEHIALDLTPSGSGLLSRCHASQYDIGRQVCFDLYNVGAVFTLAGTETIKLKIKRPDGVAVEDNITNTSSTYVVWTSASGDCDAEGNAECELIVTDNGTRIGSANFIMEVEPDPYNGNVNIKSASGAVASFSTDIEDNLVECKATITPYQGAGVDKITIINSKTAPVKSTTPYLIKETPSGNSELDKLIGGTVAFNQIIPDASMHETGTGTGGWILLDQKFSLKNNHVYLCLINGTFDSECLFRFRDVPADIATDSVNGSFIYKATTDTTNTTGLQPKLTNGVNYDFYYGVIDLTAMFGSTIADYVYTLESGTSGSGVSWLKSHGFFTKAYYPYDTGSLLSVKASKHITTGKNILDLTSAFDSMNITYTLEDGWYVVNNIAEQSNILYTNHIPLPALPDNKSVLFLIDGDNTVVSNLRIKTYDFNNTVLSQTPNGNPSSATISNEPIGYIGFDWSSSGKATFKVMVVNSATPPSTYEPYISHEYTLDDIELRGILKLDGNNSLYYDGDTYESNGSVTRKYGIVDLGSLTWYRTPTASGNYWFSSIVPSSLNLKDVPSTITPNGISDMYTITKADNVYLAVEDKIISYYTDRIVINDVSYSDVNTFKTAMDGVYLVYELATPTTETADTFTNPQVCEEGGTEEYIDGRVVEMPVGHDTIYGTDIEAVTVEFGTTVTSGVIDVTNGILTPTGDDPISVTPAYIPTFNGDNNVMSDMDGGTVEVKYYENGGA